MIHAKPASAGTLPIEMGLDEEKTVLGEEIVSEQVKLFVYIYFPCDNLRKMVV